MSEAIEPAADWTDEVGFEALAETWASTLIWRFMSQPLSHCVTMGRYTYMMTAEALWTVYLIRMSVFYNSRAPEKVLAHPRSHIHECPLYCVTAAVVMVSSLCESRMSAFFHSRAVVLVQIQPHSRLHGGSRFYCVTAEAIPSLYVREMNVSL